ncbi:hypothetical protein OG689_37610 [Kitasatospora sp. NBC_00240]|uniref:hypothetical protein n=1 Tax=Kitasatospora sp. NBC_00240 TaxID=2903567 RepID=UPI00225919B6|nr:hypothetical protein [Kitasatospora sp. NBC_00240]MCX5214914.1 hypothetical protein [Kitasatospora sp. NBC_00240]
MTTYRWPADASRPAGPPRFALGLTRAATLLAVCARVDGLFVDPPRRPFELIGCRPAGRLAEALAGDPDRIRLGDLWVQPVAERQCPEDGDGLHPWRLVDVRLLGHRPSRVDRTLVDLAVSAVDDPDDAPADPHLTDGVRLHDGRRWLADCRDLVALLPAETEDEAELRLLDCAVGGELAAALSAPGRRARRYEEVTLTALDPTGVAAASWCFPTEVVAWPPARSGAGPLDLVLRGTPWDAPAPWLRPAVEAWLAGPPHNRRQLGALRRRRPRRVARART